MKDRPTDVPGIFKTSEGVLINKDNDALKAYKIRKIKENKLNIIESDMDQLKTDMLEIKELLRGLLK
tara:strand:+ start:60 stop:260 length:201 start_codon:yes stop_codon:yes gene_type:complete